MGYLKLKIVFILFTLCFTCSVIKAQNFHGGIEDGYFGSQILSSNFSIIPEYFFATIDLSDGQNDSTNLSVINFKVTFSQSTNDFEQSDIVLNGTAGATNISLSGGPLIYNVAVSGMINPGTVSISVPTGVCSESLHGSTNASTQIINNSVLFDNQKPVPVINLQTGQTDPSSESPIRFLVTFSEDVIGFDQTDIAISGTASATIVNLTGSNSTYEVQISGMITEGTVVITIPADGCTDIFGNPNLNSQNDYNTVNYFSNGPNVSINQDVAQQDPVNHLPIVFQVEFSRNVIDFTFDDISWSGAAVVTGGTIIGSGSSYQVNINSLSGEGIITGFIPVGKVHDSFGLLNKASVSTDSTVLYDVTRPSITLSKDILQQDPTNSDIISFTADFSEPVMDFISTDVQLTGPSGANSVYIRGGPEDFVLDISGMSNPGSVTVNIPEDVVTDLAGNINLSSVNINNSVFYDNLKPDVFITSTVSSPTNLSQIPITIEFSKYVTGFTSEDINISNGTIIQMNEYVSGMIWNATVEPVSDGTINIQIPADAAVDSAGNSNNASTHFQITYQVESPLFEANNVFTPNSNLNKFWLIKNVENYNGYRLTIRNANGLIVYETIDYQNNWDGKYKNKFLPTGTYYYIFSSPDKMINYKGFINIIYE